MTRPFIFLEDLAVLNGSFCLTGNSLVSTLLTRLIGGFGGEGDGDNCLRDVLAGGEGFLRVVALAGESCLRAALGGEISLRTAFGGGESCFCFRAALGGDSSCSFGVWWCSLSSSLLNGEMSPATAALAYNRNSGNVMIVQIKCTNIPIRHVYRYLQQGPIYGGLSSRNK